MRTQRAATRHASSSWRWCQFTGALHAAAGVISGSCCTFSLLAELKFCHLSKTKLPWLSDREIRWFLGCVCVSATILHQTPTLDPLLAGLVSAFIITAVILTLLLFLKLRGRNSRPEFRRLQDLPMVSSIWARFCSRFFPVPYCCLLGGSGSGFL